MKTTLIYAGIAGKGFNSLKQGMDSGWISHGLASLSACAKSAGFEVDLVDLRALSGWEQLGQELAQRKPDVVGLGMMSVDYEPVMEAIAVVKEFNPQIITVVGGPHPTFQPDDVLSNPRIDYVVTGEGEITLIELLKAIQEGHRPAERLLPGAHPDLDSLPLIDRALFLDEWRRWGYDLNSPEVPFVPELPAPFVTIIAGRGCRYKCNFCKPGEELIFGKKTRRRSVANVIGELKTLRDRYGFASFMFHDDCLLENRAWCVDFANAYRAEGFTQPFFCQSRADLIVLYEDMVKLMRDSGLRGLFIGFESGSDRVLRFIKKGTTRKRNLDAAQVCKKYDIAIWANYMLGLPTETEDEMKETISMLKEIDPDYYSPAFYTPHPGSELYDYCLEHGLSLITSHKSYSRNPTELKIKGHDLAFLQWALTESQRRKPANAFRRAFKATWEKFTDPHRYARKAKRVWQGMYAGSK